MFGLFDFQVQPVRLGTVAFSGPPRPSGVWPVSELELPLSELELPLSELELPLSELELPLSDESVEPELPSPSLSLFDKAT